MAWLEQKANRKISKGGIASGFAFGYDPTGREIFLKQTEYIHSTFDVGRSMFISFFFDQTGRFSGRRRVTTLNPERLNSVIS